jgi:hypothetical protein
MWRSVWAAGRAGRACRRAAPGLALAAAMLSPGAAEAGPYEVEGIAVEAHAADAVTAKQAAMADGAARALAIVLQRLTRDADRARLPQVPPERLDATIANFSIGKERSSATAYIATLTFRFEPAAVQDLLASAGVPYTDRQAPPILVVPIYREAGRDFYMDGNPHLDAWRNFDLVNTLTPIRLPEGNVADQGVDPGEVLARDSGALAGLRYLYGADSVLVGLCETDAAHGQFTCSLEGAGPGGPVALKESFAGGSDPLAAAQAAVGSFLAEIEEQWKTASMMQPGGFIGAGLGAPIRLSVSFAGLAQWQALRARLAGLPGVGRIDIEALNARGALISLYYAGSGEQLSGVLAQAGMALADAGDHWVLTYY